jgi:hypothetical protein
LAIAGYVLLWAFLRLTGSDFAMLAGPRPACSSADGGDRLVCFLAWHTVLERSELTPVDCGRRAIDRVETLAGLTTFIQRHKIPETQVVGNVFDYRRDIAPA